MTISALLRPRSIAIVGASPTQGSFGAQLHSAIKSMGYEGKVHLVNHKYDEIGGSHCYHSIDEIPGAVDCVAFAVADRTLEAVFVSAAKAGAKSAVAFGRAVGSASDGSPLTERIAQIAGDANMAVCGANCMGYVNYEDGIQLTGFPFAGLIQRTGPIGIVSHSGSTWSGLVGNKRGLNYNYVISAGQELVTSVSEYLEFLVAQPQTRVVLCVLETIRHPESFLSAVSKANARGVAVVVLKLGRSEAGQGFAQSHSGAMSGRADVYDAIFERCGVISVRTLDEMLDCADLFANERRPICSGVAIGTDSGGERQLIADLGSEIGLGFPTLEESTIELLSPLLDPGVKPENPLDYWGDGRNVIASCLKVLAADRGIGTVVMASNLPDGREFTHACANAVREAHAATDKPMVVMSNIATTLSPVVAAQLRSEGIPVIAGTETGLRALRHFSEFRARNESALRRRWALQGGADDFAFPQEPSLKTHTLDAKSSFSLLEQAGIPVAHWETTTNYADAINFATRIGFPVVAKIDVPSIAHKTEVGGVALDLMSTDQVREAIEGFERLGHGSSALIQKQVKGVELILGLFQDEQFGPVFTLGAGGIFTEVLKDFVLLLPGDDLEHIANKIRSLRIFTLLNGARGLPKADIDEIATVVQKFIRLGISLSGRVSEMEVNPLVVDGRTIVAVDCLVILN